MTTSHHHRPIERRRLRYCLLLTGAMMVGEGIGGWWVNSLALISDAGHMCTHFLALFVSYVAIRIAARPATPRLSFGFYRIEILAALFNGLTLVGITIGIVWAAYGRIGHPEPVASGPMFIVACLGLVVNLATTLLLHDVGKHDINVKGAYLHMLGDTLSSVAVIAGAILMWRWQWYLIDPILSVLICVVILIWSWRLITHSVLVLMEATPRHLAATAIRAALMQTIPAIQDVHDIHLWEITSQRYAMTARIRVTTDSLAATTPLRARALHLLADQFDIEYAAIEFEAPRGLPQGIKGPPSP